MKKTMLPYEYLNCADLKDSECEILVALPRTDLYGAIVKIGRDGNVWCGGYTLVIELAECFTTRTLAASRKYGEYETRDKAVMQTMQKVIEAFYRFALSYPKHAVILGKAIRNMQQQQKLLIGEQMILF